MTLELNCPNCQARLRIPDHALGKQVRCPACSTVSLAAAERVAAAAPAGVPAAGGSLPPPPGEENPYWPSNVPLEGPFGDGELPGGQPRMTPAAIEALRGTRPWVLVVAIVLLVLGGAYVVMAIVQAIAAAAGPGRVIPVTIVFVTAALVTCAIFLLQSLFLLKFARSIGRFARSYDPLSLEETMRAQRAYWVLVGTLSLLAVGLGVLCVGGSMLTFLMLPHFR